VSQEGYKQLLEVMKKPGGAYAGGDIPEFFNFVEELFPPQEAEAENAMSKGIYGRNFNRGPEPEGNGNRGRSGGHGRHKDAESIVSTWV
jgi:hypothetical protein